MREAGLPIVPGTEDPVKGIAEAKKVAAEVGYPIMLKALAGGGGKGMRLVRSEEEMETALRLSQSEAGTSFGNDAVYIEKYIENPHHIEVQILGLSPKVKGCILSHISFSAISSIVASSIRCPCSILFTPAWIAR